MRSLFVRLLTKEDEGVIIISRIVQGREGMASASSYDMAGNGIE
jgi:hypothetical protein